MNHNTSENNKNPAARASEKLSKMMNRLDETDPDLVEAVGRTMTLLDASRLLFLATFGTDATPDQALKLTEVMTLNVPAHEHVDWEEEEEEDEPQDGNPSPTGEPK